MAATRRDQVRMGRAAALAAERGEAVREHLAALDGPHAWIEFDQAVRAAWRYAPVPVGAPLEVLLCHPDGRVREASLGLAHATPEPVAIRCADWAPPVRERARRVLEEFLERDPVATLVALTPLVLRLGLREHGRWAVLRFEEALRMAGPAASAAVRASADHSTRRFAVRAEIAAGRFGVRDLAREAAAERDPLTAALWADAALAARAAAPGAPDEGAVDLLLGGRVALVRASGVTALRGAERAAEASAYLGDRSAMVRACARWASRQAGADPLVFLRGRVADRGRVTPGEVGGFVECARRDDAAPVLRELLDHPVAGVRAAAVAGLAGLEAVEPALLFPLLDDPSAAVVRRVARALNPDAPRLDATALVVRTGPDRPAATRRAAFRLLLARGGLDGIRTAVDLLDDGDPDLRGLAEATVRSWEPTHFTAAAPREVLGGLLLRSAHVLDPYRLALRLGRLGLGEWNRTPPTRPSNG
ncbi:hypothetical protein [Streptomyces sp. NPDC048606]|uniref:hypothetical protein n=1 Tax=Streptomyces sp. NPDC048606 TaxID=3154726 RepID=UPI003449D5C0